MNLIMLFNEAKNMLNSRKKFLIYHLVGWTVFIVYEVSLVEIIRRGTTTVQLTWINYLIPYCVNIGFFYVHALFVMQYCFGEGKKRYFLFLLFLSMELAIYLLIMGLVIRTSQETSSGFFASIYPTIVAFSRQLWRAIYFMIFATAYWLIRRSFREVEKMRMIEKDALLKETERQNLEIKLVSAENAFLQAQINPHLLFNTLNFIHSEVQEVSPKASEAIISLSDMMRYSLTETRTDGKVPLEKEVEQIENLIQINQFRFNNNLCVQFKQKGAFECSRIIPLLLLPFVENLFKYGELSDPQNPATIRIFLDNNTLLFNTFNKKRRVLPFESHGIGVENVKTRLAGYYPDRFTLDIEQDESFFSVRLKISL